MRPTNNEDIKTCLLEAINTCRKSGKRKRYLCVQQIYHAKHEWDVMQGREPEIVSYMYCHWVRSTHKVQPGEVMFVVETLIKVKVDVKSWSNVMMEESDGRTAANLRHKLRYNCKEYLRGKEIDEAVAGFLQRKASKVASDEVIISPTKIVKR